MGSERRTGQGGSSGAGVAAADRVAAAALNAVWIKHRETVIAAVDTVDDAVQNGLAGRPDDGHRERAGRAAHKLAGSSGTFGFPIAGEIASRLEAALSGSPPSSLDQYPALAELVIALRRELDASPPQV
ncbi:MAG TPA: Hpt domain-containing protein [Solirubrobacteraceae bacterium]